MALFIGTSGWAYKEWKPDFYPEDLPQRSFLEYYATKLSACEINATFYRLQNEATFAKWVAGVPEVFRFSVKAHRRLTHSKTIRPDDDQRRFLDAFLTSLKPFGDRLGAILFQLPPYRKRSDEDLKALLEALPEGPPLAFEFRDPSWDANEVGELLAARGAARCVADTSGTAPEALPPGEIGYIRLRNDRYTEDQRVSWLELLTREAAVRDVYAFAKHEGSPTADPFAGLGFANWLRQETAT